MKNFRVLLLLFVMITNLSLFSQRIITVCADGSKDFKTISEGIAHASKGDIIEVCGTITNDGIELDGIIIDKDITIRGENASTTIIQGSATANDPHINKRVFTIKPGVTAIFENFTIRNGYLHGTDVADKGAGVRNYGKLILKNCSVYQNYVEKYECVVAGGIYNENGAVTAFDRLTPQNTHVIVTAF